MSYLDVKWSEFRNRLNTKREGSMMNASMDKMAVPVTTIREVRREH